MWLPHPIPNIHLCYTSPLYGPEPTLKSLLWFLFLLPGVSSVLSSLSTVCTCPDHVSFASLTFSHNLSCHSSPTPPTRLHLLPLLLIVPLHLFCVALSFIPLLSSAYLHLCRFSSICSELSLQIKMSSANITVHRDSSLTSSVNLSITLQTKRGSEPISDGVPPPSSIQSVTPSAYLTTASLSSYMSCIIVAHFSRSTQTQY